MKILVIGNANSIHICNQIKYIFSKIDNVEVTLLDLNFGKRDNQVAYDYYASLNINVVSCIIKKNLRGIWGKLAHLYIPQKRIRALREDFDYCIVQSVDMLRVLTTICTKKYYRKIVAVFWGADLLRNNQITTGVYKKFFKLCYKIVLNTEYMNKLFEEKTCHKYIDKSEVIKIPLDSFEIIDKMIDKRDYFRKELSIPLNKKMVLLCHSAIIQEQLDEVLINLAKVEKKILEKCFFVFQFTYGDQTKAHYIEIAQKFLQEQDLAGRILKEFLPREEIMKYIINTDFYISMVKTDSFSATMQEVLYSGGSFIYGSWLKYFELEDIPLKKIDCIEELKCVFEEEVDKENKEINYDIRKSIAKISLPDEIRKKWIYILKE